jgi:hypothetical protein
MGRMSDSDNDVRLLATETFATLVKLVPLEVVSFVDAVDSIGWYPRSTGNVREVTG